MLIRDMKESEVEASARIFVDGVRAAFADCLPASYLDSLNVDEIAARRRSIMRGESDVASDVRHFLAESAGEVVGWTSFGAYVDETGMSHPGTAEAFAVYLRPEYIGSGVGARLVLHLLEQARVQKFDWIVGYVFEINTKSRRMLERMGFHPDGEARTLDRGGSRLKELRYSMRL